MDKLTRLFYSWFTQIQIPENISKFFSTFLMGFTILIVAYFAYLITKKILNNVLGRLAKKTKTEWDDILIKHKTLVGITHLVPAVIIYFSADFANTFYPNLEGNIIKLGELYFMFAVIFIASSFLSSVNEIYNKTYSFSKERPITGFVQLVKIFMIFIGILAFISIIFDKELLKLLTGLGAMAAVLLLVFKDSILGFVASIQISMFNMFKVGDWIAMPSRGADGTVLEINLTTVKVQNWDKTISTIPTYALVSESVVNWKGMEEGEGRRIKRSVNIDMSSIKFCTPELLEKLSKFKMVGDYIRDKEAEIKAYNESLSLKEDETFNGRRQTNLGIFRKYLEAYLNQHPMINNDMTFLVRHLQPYEKGLPIEVYIFCKDKRWANYESIQADVFDHILAIIPEFELRVFQEPSGQDFRHFLNKQE